MVGINMALMRRTNNNKQRKGDGNREGCQMKIEDCKTVPEFFGVEMGDDIWVQGEQFEVYHAGLANTRSESIEHDSKALVGCLTGQLKWSTEPPKSEMTADEKKILREIAAWFPRWQALRLEKDGDIGIFTDYEYCNYYFGFAEESSQAYEVLAPILEKYGEINLDEYKEKINE